MQIALVAVVLLAGMWFTVLKPKPDAGAPAPVAATPAANASSAPAAPGTKGLASAVDKAKAASATSDAANAKIQAATGSPSTAAKPAAAKPAAAAAKPAAAAKTKTKVKTSKPLAAARKPGTKGATAKAVAAKPATPATAVDPSKRLLAFLPKGKTLVVLFYGNGADDAAARKAVHRTALKDSKNVVSAYVPISQVGRYDAITREVNVLTFPTVLVIGADRQATALSGFLDTRTIQQAVGDSRRDDAAAKKTSK
ncbi:MAG TPA: hypothetical protein VGO71_12300 [Baekduia sp.]|nr:hypothetical protein [Baekduia sp.]